MHSLLPLIVVSVMTLVNLPGHIVAAAPPSEEGRTSTRLLGEQTEGVVKSTFTLIVAKDGGARAVEITLLNVSTDKSAAVTLRGKELRASFLVRSESGKMLHFPLDDIRVGHVPMGWENPDGLRTVVLRPGETITGTVPLPWSLREHLAEPRWVSITVYPEASLKEISQPGTPLPTPTALGPRMKNFEVDKIYLTKDALADRPEAAAGQNE
jgi:hypothetical protein